MSRDAFENPQISSGDPIEFLASQQTRLQWGSNFAMKKIEPPAWAEELADGLDAPPDPPAVPDPVGE